MAQAAVQGVVSGSAQQGVVAAMTPHPVTSGKPLEPVMPGAEIDRIVSRHDRGENRPVVGVSIGQGRVVEPSRRHGKILDRDDFRAVIDHLDKAGDDSGNHIAPPVEPEASAADPKHQVVITVISIDQIDILIRPSAERMVDIVVEEILVEMAGIEIEVERKAVHLITGRDDCHDGVLSKR